MLEIQDWISTNCDKCGKKVERNNDALLLDYIVHPHPLKLLAKSRHLAPTEDCQGSPSRWQYLGGPRDTRGYPYSEEYGDRFRVAYRQMMDL